MKNLLRICIVIPLLLISSCEKKSSNPVDATPSTPTPSGGKITTGQTVDLGSQTIGTSGGSFTVNKPGDPLNGFQINVPANGYAQPQTFAVSYAPITSHQLGSYINPVSPLIKISSNGGYSIDEMKVKVPIKLPAGSFAMGFFYDWMQTGASIVRSSDGGASWSSSYIDATNVPKILDMDFAPNGTSVSGWAVGTDGLILALVGSLTNTVVAPQTPALYLPADNASNVPIAPILSWARSTGASKYYLQLSLNSTFSSTIVNDSTITDTTKAVGPLQSNTIYYWKVSAMNIAGMSGWSQPRSFTTIVSAPQAPTLVVPADSAINLQLNTTLSWNAVLGASLYHVQLSVESAFSAPIVNDSTVATTTRTVGPLTLATTYYWRIRAKNENGWGGFSPARQFSTIRTTSVEQSGTAIPTEYALQQNYPNPFNPATTIRFALPKASNVSLKVFDLLGREISTVVSQQLGAGYFTVRWQADVPSGTYIYRLQASEYVETKKMILLK